MSYRVFLESTVKPQSSKYFFKLLEENLPNVRSFKGCLNVSILFDEKNNKMIFDEEWQSVDDHHQYIAFITSNGIYDALIEYLEGEPKISYYQKQNI